jgi:hypothetical protein
MVVVREKLEGAFRTRSNSHFSPRTSADEIHFAARSRSESMDGVQRKDSKYNLRDKDSDISPKKIDKENEKEKEKKHKEKEKDKDKGFSIVKAIENIITGDNSKTNASKKKPEDRELKTVKKKDGSGRVKRGKSFLSLGKSGGKKVCASDLSTYHSCVSCAYSYPL